MYDMIIIGGGPGGLSCGVYGARGGLKTLVLERLFSGGQMGSTAEIANYPGIELIDGITLAMNMEKHAKACGVEIKYSEVVSVELEGKIKYVITEDERLETKTVVFCTGAKRKELGIASEKRLIGKGVSYCATCDGGFYRNKTTVVVGGGNTALEDAEYLSRFCSKVYLIHRRDSFRGVKILQKAVETSEKIELVYNSTVTDILGDANVTGVMVENVQTKETREIKADGVFVAVGTVPITDLLKDKLSLDEVGYVIAGETCETSIKGVYAVGDMRQKPLRQVITAAADGAVAAHMASLYIMEDK